MRFVHEGARRNTKKNRRSDIAWQSRAVSARCAALREGQAESGAGCEFGRLWVHGRKDARINRPTRLRQTPALAPAARVPSGHRNRADRNRRQRLALGPREMAARSTPLLAMALPELFTARRRDRFRSRAQRTIRTIEGIVEIRRASRRCVCSKSHHRSGHGSVLREPFRTSAPPRPS